MFHRKRLTGGVLALAIFINALQSGQIPAKAITTTPILHAEKEGLLYSFQNASSLDENSSVALSDLSEEDLEEIQNALGEKNIYAAHADFADGDGNAVDLQDSTRITIEGDDVREDMRNVRFFAYSDSEEMDLSAIEDYEKSLSVEDGDRYWEVGGKEVNFVTVVEPVESVSITAKKTEITLDNVQKDTSLSFAPETNEDGRDLLINGTLETDGSSFAPDKITMAGDAIDAALENGNDLSLELSGKDTTISVENSSDGAAVFCLDEDAKSFWEENTTDRTCQVAITLVSSGDQEEETAAPEEKTQAKTRARLAIRRAPKATADVVLHEGSTTQIRSDLGNGDDGTTQEYLYSDKYITKNEGEEVNGQSTYTTTIEHAVTTNKVIKAIAPEKREIVVVLDTSSSMGDKIDATNEAMSKFINEVKETNLKRKASWENGDYDDIQGDTLENHLLTINAVIKYNNKTTVLKGNKVTPFTQAEADSIISAAKLRPGYEPEGSLYDMTRTDLALSRAKTYISDPQHTSVVLMTDGEPYGTGGEGDLYYDTDTYSGLMMTYENTNSALKTARAIKDNGSTIYTIYVQSPTQYPPSLIAAAKASRDIHDLATTPEQADGSRIWSDRSLGCAFLSMVSSDYPQNGLMHGDPDGSGDYKLNGTYDDPGEGKFGEYFKMPEEIPKMVESFADVAHDIDNKTKYTFGYAGESSYVYDVVSYPFNIDTSTQAVHVYQVPRICTGEENGQKQFAWGDEEEITDNVTATVENGKYVTVKGYNYERNALTTMNKFLLDGETEQFPSDAGDYGYKLVIRFEIYANRVFGGNGIETNDSTVSGFYPSDPTHQSTWKENTDLNPEGEDWVTLYPIPMVDLNIDYQVVSDDVVIFAPQTAELDNLVTDEKNNLFVTGNNWEDIKERYDNARKDMNQKYYAYTRAVKAYQTALKNTTSDGAALQEKALTTMQEKQQAYSDAQKEYGSAKADYDGLQNYIPNGDNNAYVDIHYVMTGPRGQEIGTMDIPHGTAYDGSNLKWTWTNTDYDGKIRLHGDYHIKATVTPVDTTREESHTGSTAAGTGKPTDFTADPSAHIYTYHMKGIDSSVWDKTTVSLIENKAVKTGDISSTAWLSANTEEGTWSAPDGTTPDENGDTVVLLDGSSPYNGTQPEVTMTIPDKTNVTGSSGNFVVKGKTGDYIPVAVKVTRQAGKLDKRYPNSDRVTQNSIPLNDNDELYLDADGNKISSITWEHVCDYVENCNQSIFATAQAKGNAMDGKAQNNVRYLMHIERLILPKVHKHSVSPTVEKSKDPSWTVTLDNTDAEVNADKDKAASSMIDILPYNGDGRQNPATGEYTGSHFSGNLYYKSVQIDFTNAQNAKALFESAKSKLYYTSDTAIRESEQDNEALSNFAWQEAAIESTDGDKLTFTLPADAIAIKADTILSFGESAVVSMTAGLDDPSLANGGDVYANTAFVFRNDTRTNTETTMVSVMPSGLSGMLWEDANADGIRQDSEQPIAGALVGLYAPHNPSGKGAAITVDGTEYDAVYDVNGNEVAPVTTGADGAYHFTSLRAGTYFAISQGLDHKYLITGKHKTTDTTIDSDAEETQPVVVNTETIQLASGKTVNAWIRDIAVGDSETKEHLDIGMIPVSGSVDITKNLDQIYFPSTMTEEEKQYYYPTFHYTLHCPDGTDKYTTVQMSQTKLTGYARFANLPAGTYTLEEEVSLNYKLDSIESDDIKTQDVSARTVTFTVTAENQNFHVTFKNKMIGIPPAGDQNQVINHIPMHTPISLKVDYTGPALIQSATATSYAFKAEEIHGVVTYDDGSTQDVTLGTTGFSLSPETVTNMMNTGNNAKTIHAYYSERGVLLEDTFAVNVNLKPAHKFKVVYHANDNVLAGKATAAFADSKKTHTVYYLYDQLRDVFYSYNGTYEQPAVTSTNYSFGGWSTSSTSLTGSDYKTEADLKALALDSNVSQINLYAHWETEVTYHAAGGTLTGGTLAEEKALNGKASGTIKVAVGTPAATALSGVASGKQFLLWNTAENGTGTELTNYGKIQEPVTFYAIYLQSIYNFVNDAQTFVAPVSGNYRIECWGASGGTSVTGYDSIDNQAYAGKGAYTAGTIHLNAGETLYVYVGGCSNRFNGGGDSGATDIRLVKGSTWKDFDSLKSRVMVAAGGGVGVYNGPHGFEHVQFALYGGAGGALVGGSGQHFAVPGYEGHARSSPTGAGQTYGGRGYRQVDYNNEGAGTQTYTGTFGVAHSYGGGGGYYGGACSGSNGNWYSGSGGSSYVSGYAGCNSISASATANNLVHTGSPNHYSGIVFSDPQMIAGNRTMPTTTTGTMVGNGGDGVAKFTILSRD